MRVRLPLWIHQLVEYLLAVLIVTQSINAGKASTFMAVTGAFLFLLTATTDGPMGGLRWIPPQVHRALDLVVIAALVAAPIVTGTTDPVAWALCLLAAGALLWLHWHTLWRRVPRRTAAAAEFASRPAPVPPTTPAPTEPTKAASLGESARNLGKTVDRTTRGASRAAGRIYGRARAQRTEKGEDPEPKT